jgi:hypothetical protein
MKHEFVQRLKVGQVVEWRDIGIREIRLRNLPDAEFNEGTGKCKF